MRKRGLPDKSVTGMITPPLGHESAHALSLLGAAPFLLHDSRELIWPQPQLCENLIRGANSRLPGNIESWLSRLTSEGRRERGRALRSLTWDGAQYAVNYQLRREDGQQIWVEERGERLAGIEMNPTEISGVITNIDNAKDAELRAGYKASHDELTGLWNETRMAEGLEQLIALVQRSRVKAIFLRLRISNLPDINATYGFEIGDRLIKAIAGRLSAMTRMPDNVARIGGISFGLGFYGTGTKEVDVVSKRLLESLSDMPYQSPHGALYAEFDIASTTLGDQAHSPQDAFIQTRAALQASEKQLGNVVQFTPEMVIPHTARPRRETTADDILSALNDRRISLAFQPIVDAKTRDLHHYECLLRLRTDEGEVISAGNFIMASERLGLVHLLDRRALELAAEALRQFPEIHIALNVSAGTVKDMDTADAYIAALKALGPDVRRVTLELTETVALEAPAMASRFSVETRTLGCEFAIDDFGPGYTTFRNLMAIEADTIKIDGTFIQGLSLDPSKQTFVRMMVDLAQTFSVKTVAEMVDNRADADLLKRLGVDYLQGYMFGIPSAAPAWRREVS